MGQQLTTVIALFPAEANAGQSRDRRIQPEPACLGQLHDRRGRGEHLGQRCEIEDRIRLHGSRGGHQRHRAESTPIHDPAMLLEENHSARNMPGCYFLTDDFADPVAGGRPVRTDYQKQAKDDCKNCPSASASPAPP